MPSYEERSQIIKALSEQEYFEARLRSQQKSTESVRIGALRGDTGRYEVLREDGGISGNGVKTFNTAPPNDGFVRGLVPNNGQAIALDGKNRKREVVFARRSKQTATNNIAVITIVNNEILIYGDRETPESIYKAESPNLIVSVSLNKTGSGLDDWIVAAIVQTSLLSRKVVIIIGATSFEKNLPIALPNQIAYYLQKENGFIWELKSGFSFNGDIVETIGTVPVVTGCGDPYATNYNARVNNNKPETCIYTPRSLKGRIALRITETRNITGGGTETVSYIADNRSGSEWNSKTNPAAPSFSLVTVSGFTVCRYTFNGDTQDFGARYNGITGAEIIYGEGIRGCTVFGCSNYNPSATVDDGTCEFGSPTGDNFAYVDTSKRGVFARLSGEYANPSKGFDYIVGFSSDETIYLPDYYFENYRFRVDRYSLGSSSHPQSSPVYTEIITRKDVNNIPYCLARFFVNGELAFFYPRKNCVSMNYEIIKNNSPLGCIDPRALNYSALSAIDNGSCIYDPLIYRYTGGTGSKAKVETAFALPSEGIDFTPNSVEINGGRTAIASSQPIEINIFKNKKIRSNQILLEQFDAVSGLRIEPSIISTEKLLLMGLNQSSCLVRSLDISTGIVTIKFFVDGIDNPIVLKPEDFIYFVDTGYPRNEYEAFIDCLDLANQIDSRFVSLIDDKIYFIANAGLFSGDFVGDAFLNSEKSAIITGLISSSGVSFSYEIDSSFVVQEQNIGVLKASYYPPN